MKVQKSLIKVGVSVTHTCVYGMGKSTGLVVAEAGNRYSRRYVWVNYTHPKTHKTYNCAFWDQVLRLASTKVIVRPATVELDSNVALHTNS
jgi:hypothetical protein